MNRNILIISAIILFIIASGCVQNAQSADRPYNNGWTLLGALPTELGLSKIDVGNNTTCYYARDVVITSLSCIKGDK